MYFYKFYQILKKFLEILKISWFLAENDNLARFSRHKFGTSFSMENLIQKYSELAENWYTCCILCV